MVITTGIIFGPAAGGIYAFCGALLNAAVTYWVGGHLARDTVRRMAASRLNRITNRRARKGILAVAIIRLLPIAPYSIVNAVAGASRVSVRDFLLGTAIGIAPPIALTVIFVDRAEAAIVDPRAGTLAALAAATAVLLSSAFFVWRRFGRAVPAPLWEADKRSPAGINATGART